MIKQFVTDERVVNDLFDKKKSPYDYEFYEDYSPNTPNRKLYRSKTTKEFLAIYQKEPRIYNGKRIKRNWLETETGWYYSESNMFSCVAFPKTGETILRFEDEHMRWTPIVRLDNVEIGAIFDGVHIETTHGGLGRYSALEWNYGICRRRLFLKHGKLFELFIFDKDPGGDVEIESSDLSDALSKYRAAQFAHDCDGYDIDGFVPGEVKKIPAASFKDASFPIFVDDSTNFVSTNTTDGFISAYGEDFSDVRNASVGNNRSISGDDLQVFSSESPYDDSYSIIRAAVFFDTSSLDDSAVISAASLYLYCRAYKSDSSNGQYLMLTDYTYPSIHISGYGLFDTQWGTGYVNCDGVGWKTFACNSTGIAGVSKTGSTAFGLRNRLDWTNTTPGDDDQNYHYFRATDYTGTTYDPYLTVTYTVPVTYIARPMIFN